MGIMDELPPQDVFYGIDHTNIAEVLTADNWQSKATIRFAGTAWMYLWIRELTGKRNPTFLVRYYSDAEVPDVAAKFDNLADAIRYINGADDGLIARSTRPATRSEWPDERKPSIFMTGFRS